MADKEYTYSDVSEHATKKDLFVVVHDKVYNASSFVDEHPYVCLHRRDQFSQAPPPTHGQRTLRPSSGDSMCQLQPQDTGAN